MPIENYQADLLSVSEDIKALLFAELRDPALAAAAFEAIQRWTSDEPALMVLLCDLVIQYSAQLALTSVDAAVEKIVQLRIIEDWEQNAAARHLKQMSQMVTAYEMKDSLLIAYLQTLTRGEVPLNYSAEQEILLRAGLLKVTGSSAGNLADNLADNLAGNPIGYPIGDGMPPSIGSRTVDQTVGKTVSVANAIYEQVFDKAWIERQIPGITRSVTVVRKTETQRPSAGSKRTSQVTVVACGLAVLAAMIAAYFRDPAGPMVAKVEGENGVEATAIGANGDGGGAVIADANAVVPPDAPVAQEVGIPAEGAIVLKQSPDRTLFDTGIEHATSARWLPMLRSFCQLPVNSAYFEPAYQQLTQWAKLYPRDIQVAYETLVAEGAYQCALAEEILQGINL